METGKSKVSPKSQLVLVSNIDHFQRDGLRAEDLQGTWRIMDRFHGGAKSMVVVTCPACTEFGLLSDHIVGEDGGVTPSMDCQNDDCSYHTFIHLDNWDHGVLDNQGEVTRMGEPNLRQQRLEWESWKSVCTMLKDMGVVTAVDLDAKPANRDTAGVRLLAGLRAWGDALVELRGVRPPIPDPVMLGIVTQLVPGLLAHTDHYKDVVKEAKALAEEILKQCSR